MTVDATLRSIYSAADETIEAFDRLQQSTLLRRSHDLQRLESVAAGLNGAYQDEPEAPLTRERREDRPATGAAPEPFIPLPKRTTHGGPFGPKVAAIITAEIVRKRGW